ncbi:Na/Pi symporter [Kordiimonas laminariae]|uniref:Na/Pi symporter n=1 Tax=Kordiimonas laminariae TaxID=2917717 RepID=UPI001FF39C24|nr:Na/Pi symporter [Kordiimonas laminariae]MCK0068000.1 Na/Pi symporter [Kordiimonas laminariae]
MTDVLPGRHGQTSSGSWGQWFAIAGLVYVLLVAVATIGGGFKLATGDQARELFAFASNPITALVIGTIATALIQSSSTVTSIIVGLVAGGLPVEIAIPMVMGSNIGTTITNTIVSLGHVRQGEEFKRAFAAATIHDFFNVICVIIFLPLEIMFGFLQKVGAYLASFLVGGENVSMGGFNFIKPLVSPPINLAEGTLERFGASDVVAGILMIFIGIGMIFLSISFIGRLLKELMTGRAKDIMHYAVGRGPVSGLASGTLITVLVQSSSTTTSLIVPLAGSGVFSLRQIYPFTLGANIGTCITALLAATAVVGGNAYFALQVALVHLVYNSLGVLVVYGIPFLRNIPPQLAEWLSGLAVKKKIYVAAYIGTVFFLVPSALIALSETMGI